MHWQSYKLKDGTVARHTVVSSEGGYGVLRCTENGRETGRFLAWRYRGQGIEVLGGYDSADDAKTACDAHWAKVSEAA